ncbi:DUF6538 domain-containing protein [Pseudomonas monteilii]
MTQRNNLYRRSSGIYVFRLTVPPCHRHLLAQREIHVSTHSRCPSVAKAVACRLLSIWDQSVSELEMPESKPL